MVSNAARLIPAASIESPPRYLKGVTGNVPVAAEKASSTLPEIGNDYNVGLVISRASFQPRLPLAHFIRRSQVRVPVTAPDLQAAKLVNQKEVNHTGNRVGAIHSRGPILQYVDVIDHREGKEVNVHTLACPRDAQRTVGDAFAIDQNQSLFGQEAAQVELDRTVTTIGDVQVNGATRLLRQERLQVGRVADAQFFDVCRTIRIYRIRARLFSAWNVGASDDNSLNFGNLTECDRGQEQMHCRYAPSGVPDQWSLDDKPLSLIVCGLANFRTKNKGSS